MEGAKCCIKDLDLMARTVVGVDTGSLLRERPREGGAVPALSLRSRETDPQLLSFSKTSADKAKSSK